MANLSGQYKAASASGNISANPCNLNGVFISSATGATLAIFDDSGTGTSQTVVSAFTPASIGYYPMPFVCNRGINAVITGTLTFTVGFN